MTIFLDCDIPANHLSRSESISMRGTADAMQVKSEECTDSSEGLQYSLEGNRD